MKRRSEFTTLERAIQTVDGFSHVFTTLRQQTALRGQNESTLYNYMHRIALESLHFKRLPENILDEELKESSEFDLDLLLDFVASYKKSMDFKYWTRTAEALFLYELTRIEYEGSNIFATM